MASSSSQVSRSCLRLARGRPPTATTATAAPHVLTLAQQGHGPHPNTVYTIVTSIPASTSLASISISKPLARLLPSATLRTFSTTRPFLARDNEIGDGGRGGRRLRESRFEVEEDEPVVPDDVIANLTKRMRAPEREGVERFHRDSHEEVNAEDASAGLYSEVTRTARELESLAETEGPDRDFEHLSADDMPNRRSFWYDEDDPNSVTPDSDSNGVDMVEMGHEKLEEFKEFRHYARVAAWEMPLLSQFARPFEPPGRDQVLRFRYTTYMGDQHPAESKVVVQVSPDDLDLSEVQRNKMKKLAGTRYNPDTEMVKMSCESFENQAQNKRYLSDLVDRMIEMAKDPTDTFEDIPLDFRHHKPRRRPRFPEEWKVTPERKTQLEAERERAQLSDARRAEVGALIDGRQRIKNDLAVMALAEQGTREILAGKAYKKKTFSKAK